MSMEANVNFYMFHGGTNFGFSNGVNLPFLPQPTSYDYDAPISEAGDITEKYLAMRDAISKYFPLPNVAIPPNSLKKNYGKVKMTHYVPLVDAIMQISNQVIKSLNPQSFEKMGQGHGFVLYKTKLDNVDVHEKILSIPNLHDRAYVQIGDTPIGVLYRAGETSLKIDLPNNENDTLYIIVENMGRLNFGDDMLDNKVKYKTKLIFILFILISISIERAF
jgi:hypothetical protein